MIGRNIELAHRLTAILESPATHIPPASMAVLAQTMAEATAKLAAMATRTGQPSIGRMLRVHAASSANVATVVTRGRGSIDPAWSSTTSINQSFVYDSACSRAAADPKSTFQEVAALCYAHGRILTAMAGYAQRDVEAGHWRDADAAPDALRENAESFQVAVRQIETATVNDLVRPTRRRSPAPAPEIAPVNREEPRWDM